MVIDLTKDNADILLSENERVIIKFYAFWCSPCKILAPMYDGIADELTEGPELFTQVNTDAEPDLATKYGVAGLPTVVVIDNGEVIARETGIPRINTLLQRLKEGLL